MKKLLLILAIAASLCTISVSASAQARSSKKARTEKPSKPKSAEGLSTVTFVTNMHCENCVKKITENLSFMRGVKDLDVSLDSKEVTVKYDSLKTSEAAFVKELGRLGYKAERK